MRHVILLGLESFSSGPKAMIGQILGHYKVIEQLGSGGMGDVYLAEDTRLRRKVAVKLLPANLTSDKDRSARFRQEASAASALNHPNIIVIYEIGETDDGVLYIVSEYILGKTLRERINSGNIDLVEALDVAIQTAYALSAAHQSGIIHRDVKPENVIIRPDGYVKILDFGLAKLIEPQASVEAEASTLVKPDTTPGMILGTLQYMSPEQARGKEVDERTDIFSLGVLLYEMIAGRPPFTGKTNADVIAAVLTQEPVSLASFVPETSNELQCIVTKMFRKERGERYQTMHDCIVDLKEVRNELRFAARLHSKEISPFRQPTAIIDAHTTGDLQRVGTGPDGRMSTVRTAATSGGARRKAIAAAVILGVLFLSAAVTAYYLGIWQRSPVVLATQNVRQLTIWPGLDDFPSMSPDGNSVAFCSDHNGTFEIYVKALTPGASEIQLTNDGGQNFEPAWSHDGTRIAFYSKLRGGIWVVPSTGGHVKQLTEFGSYPAWSSDDKQIVFQSFPVNDLGAFARNALPPSTLWVVPATGGGPRQLTKAGDPPGGHGSPAFSPDGQRVAFETNTFNSSSIWTVSINGDHLEPITPQGPGGGYAPVYSADGRSIFYHSGQLFQVDIDPRSGKSLGEANRVTGFAQPPSVIRRISFSADGKRIAYSLVRRTESISSVMLQSNTGVQAGSPVALVSNATGRNNYPAFSPDGKRIAFSVCAVGGTGCDIWLADVDGSDQIQLTTAESTELAPSWFPDGVEIAYISNRTGHDTYWAINLNTKRERMLLDVEDNLDYVRLSPDGKKVLFNRIRDGVMNVWKAALDGGEPKQLTFDEEMMAFPTWSPDGKFIAFQVKRGDDTNVMIMPSEGGTAEQLTFDKGQSWIFGWSPDGDKILFAGQRDGYWNAWWVSRSTKKKQQLTDYKKLNSFVRYPAWSPKGDQIAYEYSETTGNIWVADVK